MTRRGTAILALIVAVIVGAAVLAWRSSQPAQAPAASDVGGSFHLVDQSGRAADERVLAGKWSAVFFGYTYCPDVCPTTLSRLGAVAEALGPAAERFQVIFITVDPARDTPAALAAYLASPTFPKGVRGLTGSAEQIAAVAKAYHVFYQKVPQAGGYTMDHSSVVYLMDPKGRFVAPLDLSGTPAAAARTVEKAMADVA
jgi:protein SCO1/2